MAIYDRRVQHALDALDALGLTLTPVRDATAATCRSSTTCSNTEEHTPTVGRPVTSTPPCTEKP
ncbi:hypothetical protein [Streptomyces sp. NPDC005507]|uniref:hypothetical protein n=1 Tax=Streptomyces sp. NPDC005507 TaxID=3154885 RepID=UPI0033A3E556